MHQPQLGHQRRRVAGAEGRRPAGHHLLVKCLHKPSEKEEEKEVEEEEEEKEGKVEGEEKEKEQQQQQQQQHEERAG